MDRRSKIIVGIFVAVLLVIIATEIVRPKPINWRPSYTATDKIPFGCFVLFNELPTLFSKAALTNVNESLYKVLSQRDSLIRSNYILINDIISFDQQEHNQLLNYVSKGNDVFIAASSFSDYLSDTLKLNVQSLYDIKEDSVTVSLTNSAFKNKKYVYTRGQHKGHFTSLDTLNATVLGYVEFTDEQNSLFSGKPKKSTKAVNFIRMPFGKGNFYLNSIPQAYSNYYMLGGNQEYVANTFSYLETRPLFWDNYKKSGRVIINSPMRFVLNQVSLKWAYYLTVLGLLLFVIFKAKREQRIIPVITPLANTSVEFAKTVGSLYYQHKDYTDLVAKKLKYFLEFVRSQYHIDTSQIKDKTAHDLAAKSGKSITETKALLEFIGFLRKKKAHTVEDIIQLNKKITSFKH